VGSDRVGLILGDNLFYGDSLPAVAERGAPGTGAVIYTNWVSDPAAYGVVEFDAADRPVSIVEKPKGVRSNWAVNGLYFYDADVCEVAAHMSRSARGELEITDVNAHYLQAGRLTVEKLGRGFAWLDTGSPSSLLRAAQFVETVEDRQGLQIGSPEEVAWRKGFINDANLRDLIEPIKQTEYGEYFQRLLATR
jgi:glucose-1-phosphate thymidylyltransferase